VSFYLVQARQKRIGMLQPFPGVGLEGFHEGSDRINYVNPNGTLILLKSASLLVELGHPGSVDRASPLAESVTFLLTRQQADSWIDQGDGNCCLEDVQAL
jgi:hypothetical protein